MEWYYIQNSERVGPVTEEAISQLLAAGTIDKSCRVWNRNLPDWQPISASSLAPLLAESSGPPPVPGTAVKNSLVWLLASSPIFGGICTMLLSPLVDTAGGLFWLTPALSLLCVYADDRRLKLAGYDTDAMGAAWLIPVFLWKRAKILRQNNAYFWVWCVTFAFAILFL